MDGHVTALADIHDVHMANHEDKEDKKKIQGSDENSITKEKRKKKEKGEISNR